MAIDKKALKKAQRKRIYQRKRNNRINSYNSANSSYSNYNPTGGLNNYTSSNPTGSLNSYKSAAANAATYAVKSAENSNEDNNAGVNALTFSASAGISISGRISHSPKAARIDSQSIRKSLTEGFTETLTPEDKFISHQRAVNQSVRSQTQLFNGFFRPNTNIYNRNRKKLYKRLQKKCRDIKANIVNNIKSLPKKTKDWVANKAKDIAMRFLKTISASVLGIFLAVMIPSMFLMLFLETSSSGVITDTLEDIQYAYPADENDITRATIHWQTLAISLNNRFAAVPNIVQEQGQSFDYTKSEKCDIEDDTHKILSFLSAYYMKWEFNEEVSNFMTQIFNEMYVIEYGFTSEQKTLTSIKEFKKSELPDPLPANYKLLSEYTNSEGVDISVVSVAETKEYVTLNYSIKEVMNFDDIVNKYLNDLQKENYVSYYERKGGAIKAFSSPFAFDWTNTITSPFGYRQWEDGSTEFHKGVDFGVANGTEILAIADGTVNVGTGCNHNYPKDGSCGCNGGFGNYVEIICEDGTIILCGHMSQVAVANGQTVKNGQVIGYSGCTGWSTGFHLHLQIVKDGEYIDPLTFIKPYSP